jgi:hypothetical protein
MRAGFDPAHAAARLRAAADWLGRSQDVTGCGGSSAYYAPLLGWAPPYPETTGYIIPTLYRAADLLGNPGYAERAERMARWLLTLQAGEGWFPGGTWKPGRKHAGSVFNTGQILFGLVEAADRTGASVFRDAAARAAAWLTACQRPDGRWLAGAYVDGYSPSYYAHVCWPLALHWTRHGGENVRRCAVQGLDAILSDRTESGTFRNWGFRAGGPAFTHTIGYTLQGLAESARLLGLWEPYGAAAQASAAVLLRKYEVSKRLAGAYGVNWEPTSWYVCLTGHCQVASTWLRLHAWTGDPRFLNAALKALDEVCRRQRLVPHRPNVHGAIAGSAPAFGRYMALRYPNWAAKFFFDAVAAARDSLEALGGVAAAREGAVA